jgi:hypothetical protein
MVVCRAANLSRVREGSRRASQHGRTREAWPKPHQCLGLCLGELLRREPARRFGYSIRRSSRLRLLRTPCRTSRSVGILSSTSSWAPAQR